MKDRFKGKVWARIEVQEFFFFSSPEEVLYHKSKILGVGVEGWVCGFSPTPFKPL